MHHPVEESEASDYVKNRTVLWWKLVQYWTVMLTTSFPAVAVTLLWLRIFCGKVQRVLTDKRGQCFSSPVNRTARFMSLRPSGAENHLHSSRYRAVRGRLIAVHYIRNIMRNLLAGSR